MRAIRYKFLVDRGRVVITQLHMDGEQVAWTTIGDVINLTADDLRWVQGEVSSGTPHAASSRTGTRRELADAIADLEDGHDVGDLDLGDGVADSTRYTEEEIEVADRGYDSLPGAAEDARTSAAAARRRNRAKAPEEFQLTMRVRTTSEDGTPAWVSHAVMEVLERADIAVVSIACRRTDDKRSTKTSN